MMDYASEWDSLPASAPAPEMVTQVRPVVEIKGTASSLAPSKATDYAAEWDAIPATAPASVTAAAPSKRPEPPATSTPIDLSNDDLLREAGRGTAEIGTHLVKGVAQLGATAAGNIWDVARGGSLMAPLTTGARWSDWIGALGGEPQTYLGRYGSQALDFLSSIPQRITQPLGDIASEAGAPPAVSALLASSGPMAAALLGARARDGAEVPKPRVEPTLEATEGPSPGTVAGAGPGGRAAGEPISAGTAGGRPSGGGTNAPTGGRAAVPGVSVPAAASVPAEFQGIATPAEQLPPTAQLSSTARQFFPAVKKSTIGADLPSAAQAERAQVMRAVGIDPADGFRDGALKGNPKTQASEVMTAETPGPLGDVYQKKFADEQNALRGYAQEMKDAAGGTQSGPELPQEQALQIRGQNIVKPLELLDQFYNKRASDLYAQARANGATGVTGINLDALLKDSDFRQTLVAQGKQSLLDALDAQVDRFHTEGWGDQQGPNTVGAAEAFRQWLNQTGTPETGRVISQVKQALDNDVAQAGGADTFKAARAMWKQYQQTLGDPKGISSLLQDESGNRVVPFNQVSQKVTTMADLDQFKHIVDTLKSIRNIDGIDSATIDASNKALQEIRQQFTENTVNAGNRESWNPRDVNKTLNANAYRMGQVFTPAELQRFRTLNDAGFILENQTRYPGAVVQGLSLMHRGAIQVGAGAAGAAAELAAGGGVTGGAAAGFVGSRMGAFLTDRMGRVRAEQIQRQMRSNAQKYFPSGASAP